MKFIAVEFEVGFKRDMSMKEDTFGKLIKTFLYLPPEYHHLHLFSASCFSQKDALSATGF